MKLSKSDLFSLEQYDSERDTFRAQIMQHKKNRQVSVGPNSRLYFEDRLTMQYQIQEILRIEKVFQLDAIQEELDIYNPLIPDGQNWKATFMIEYPDEAQRKVALGQLLGIERAISIIVDALPAITPIANEDLQRETQDKTSAVHFLRFELNPKQIAAVKGGGQIVISIDHPNYQHNAVLAENIASSLASDLR